MHQRQLHVERQRRRDAVRIDLVRREPFGLEENLVARPVGEAHDLVLDRRAIARPDALDDPGESGERSRPPRMISCVRSLVCVIQQRPAPDASRACRRSSSPARDRRRAALETRRNRSVRPSRRGGVPVFSRPTGNPSSRSARPEASPAPRPRARPRVFQPDVDQPGQERPGRQDHRVGLERHAHLRHHAGHARDRRRRRRPRGRRPPAGTA